MASRKKYLQLHDAVMERIRSGSFSPGDKLPTEQAMMEEYGFSRQTVRQALGKMEADGFITRLQGSGSFVSAQARTICRTHRIAVITT